MDQYWLSFASHKEGFLGVVIVEAEDEIAALREADRIAGKDITSKACGISGGIVSGFEPKWINRLITKPEIDEIGEITTQPSGIKWGYGSM